MIHNHLELRVLDMDTQDDPTRAKLGSSSMATGLAGNTGLTCRPSVSPSLETADTGCSTATVSSPVATEFSNPW